LTWVLKPIEPLLRREFLPQDLGLELARHQFPGRVAVQARPSLEETRWLLDLP
jgi:L-fuconolactonase